MEPNTNIDAPVYPLFALGFRPFFLGAGLFAVISITLWAMIYLLQFTVPLENISSAQWHAHEMIYGYSMAVIAGFLLTAVRNWTGISTLTGYPLALLFFCWLATRLLWLGGTSLLAVAAIADVMFSVIFLIAISRPIIKTRQWKQLAILSKVTLLIIFNSLFYLGAIGMVQHGIFWGTYGGLYLVISLILTMGRRVIPFFIEKGVGYPVTIPNSKWLDISSLVALLGFFIVELFIHHVGWSSALALCVFLVNAIRLILWHTPGIWKKPLLWSLYLSLWMISLGFLLLAIDYVMVVSQYLAVHAMAFGGIGIITLSMMSRVSLGHTGRNINQPPAIILPALLLLLAGGVIRVFMPILSTQLYPLWIGLSALLWIIAFVLFTIAYLPVLITPRIDGQPG